MKWKFVKEHTENIEGGGGWCFGELSGEEGLDMGGVEIMVFCHFQHI